MGRDVERRDTDIGSGETRRYVGMRQRTRNGHAFQSCGGLPNATELGTVSDQHGLDISAATRTQLAYRFDEMYRAVPRAKRADEDQQPCLLGVGRTEPCRVAPGWNRSVSAPHSVSSTRVAGTSAGKNPGARRHDEIGRTALPVTPATERLDDHHAVDPWLDRTRMVDDRGIHFEHGDRARSPAQQASPSPPKL